MVSAVPVINLVYAALCAMAVWSYLYNARSVGLMHTLFALEDTYGLRVEAADGEACLVVDASQGARAAGLREMLRAWREQAAKLEAGEITREEYDRWRYRYPEFGTSGQWHKISPSQELSDAVVKRGRKRMKRGE